MVTGRSPIPSSCLYCVKPGFRSKAGMERGTLLAQRELTVLVRPSLYSMSVEGMSRN